MSFLKIIVGEPEQRRSDQICQEADHSSSARAEQVWWQVYHVLVIK